MNYAKIANFTKDQSVEHKIGQFLDDNFYCYLSAAHDFSRATELSDQFAGIDVRLGSMLVDEKSKNTSSPNEIKDFYASLELYHEQRDGTYTEGWFANKSMKTTHYFFEYRFEDECKDISSIIIVAFSKSSMKKHIDQNVGYDNAVRIASGMQFSQKGTDDVVLRDHHGRKFGKLTKSYEGAAVMTFKLTDLSAVDGSAVIECVKGRRPKRLTFQQLREKFT